MSLKRITQTSLGRWISLGLLLAVAASICACTKQSVAPSGSLNTPKASKPIESALRIEEIPSSALGGYLAGNHARNDFDPEAAIEFYSRTLTSDPDNPQILHHLLVGQVALGNLETSLNTAHRLANVRESEPLALLVMAAESVKEQQFTKSGQYLDRFPETSFYPFIKSLLSAWNSAGNGDVDAAFDKLELLKTSPNFVATYDYHSALIADIMEKEKIARSAYTRALSAARRPGIRSIMAAGSFYERNGDIEVARELYESYPMNGPEQTIVEQALENLEKGTPRPKMVATANQGFAEALFEIAASLFQERAYEPSLIYCQIALFLRPEFDAAQMQLADIYVEMGKPALAVEAFSQIPQSSPYAWSARIRMASALDAIGKTEEAGKELRSLALQKPTRVDPLLALADMLRLKEEYGSAIVVYDEAIARIEPIEKQHWTVFYARGMSLERNGNWEQAESDFLRALRLHPDQPLVLNYLGYSWVEQGTNLLEARSMIERAVAQRPNDGYIVDSLGWVLYRLEDFDAALVHLERAVELRPDDPVINDHYGDALWAADRHSEAKFQWLRALSLRPEAELRKTLQQKLQRPNPKRKVHTISKS